MNETTKQFWYFLLRVHGFVLSVAICLALLVLQLHLQGPQIFWICFIFALPVATPIFLMVGLLELLDMMVTDPSSDPDMFATHVIPAVFIVSIFVGALSYTYFFFRHYKKSPPYKIRHYLAQEARVFYKRLIYAIVGVFGLAIVSLGIVSGG